MLSNVLIWIELGIENEVNPSFSNPYIIEWYQIGWTYTLVEGEVIRPPATGLLHELLSIYLSLEHHEKGNAYDGKIIARQLENLQWKDLSPSNRHPPSHLSSTVSTSPKAS